MKRRRPQKAYNAYRGKGNRRVFYIAGAVLAVLALALLAAGFIFRKELAITKTIRPVSGSPAYFMEVRGGYYFDEFLEQGGASSDQEVGAFLSKKISKGFYTAQAGGSHVGCSVLSSRTEDGFHLWGRNYDWSGSVPVIVRHIPDEGYASLSTCDLQNITGRSKTLPEGMMNKMLAIAALYVPLDGVNTEGLCVADLEVNEGGMPDPDTDKPDLTVTTAIRLLLDRAATVDEALALLEQYDIHASGGISHHLAISDASGDSVAVEFTEDGFTAVPTHVVTNFNLANGDTSAGGESARTRYETLLAQLEAGVTTADQVRSALSDVSQPEGQWVTQWSMVYDQSTRYITWYFNRDFAQGVSFTPLMG